MQGSEDRGSDCWTVNAGVGASRTRGVNSREEKGRKDKRFLGALGGKGWLRKENHECRGSFQQELACYFRIK